MGISSELWVEPRFEVWALILALLSCLFGAKNMGALMGIWYTVGVEGFQIMIMGPHSGPGAHDFHIRIAV